MITRDRYISQIRGFYDSDLIKIITGIRRSGKSIIMEQIMDELRTRGAHIIYLNFEDERTLSATPDAASLISYIDGIRDPAAKNYLFFDEIQEVKDWQIACKTLRLDDNSLFITGSNSKLLSKEFTDAFSGRFISFEVRPFVYKEILEYTNELGTTITVDDYLIWGGFPKRFEFSPDDQLRYLQDLNRSIVENDLIIRYKIKNTDLFRRVTNYVLRSNSRIFSARSVEKYLRSERIDGSINTIIKYLSYLEEAYVIKRIHPTSTRTKSELDYYFKLYDADVSLNSIRVTDGRYDLTHNLENIVYNELIYMGYSLEVYNDEKGEIDFIASRGPQKYYIQVAYSVVEPSTYDREFSAFASLDNSAQKILVTNDAIDYSTSTVRHIRLPDFLTLSSLE